MTKDKPSTEDLSALVTHRSNKLANGSDDRNRAGETMSKFARTILIRAPAADVWAAMIDVETWPAWASQFKRLEGLDAGPLAAGSRVRVRPKGLPASLWLITEYEEGRSFTWESSPMPGIVLVAGHVLTADPTGTHAEFSLDAIGVLGKLLAPLLRRTVFSRNTRSATRGLKRFVEAKPMRASS